VNTIKFRVKWETCGVVCVIVVVAGLIVFEVSEPEISIIVKVQDVFIDGVEVIGDHVDFIVFRAQMSIGYLKSRIDLLLHLLHNIDSVSHSL
jgi:hypothetical protein